MADVKFISIDGMGGDHAPRIVVEGLERFAQSNPNFRFLIHGDEAQLKPLLEKAPTAAPRVTIRHTDKSVPMDAKPSQMLRQGKGTSMWNAIESVKGGEAVAAVSAGNTGALMALSMFILRKVEGVHRPALVASWPTRKGVTAMLDLGADIAADAGQLVEFAIMGVAFARAVNGVKNPKVALLNIGEEELKGHESIREAARLIRSSNLPFDFRGYIEADKIGSADIDVIVTDGFTGNIAIKTAEGIARMISDMLKDAFKSGPIAMLGAALAMPALKQFRSKMDPRKVNGGVFIGLNGVVVKSHGGTDAVGFAQAIKVAAGMGESSFRAEVEENLRRLAPAPPPPSPAEQAAQ
jgi:glycerol-3-phosphate acyltransferase PlsX